LSWLFSVFLFGAVVTPFAGRLIDRIGFRATLLVALTLSMGGMLLTLFQSLPLILCGLAITSSALFVCQSATTTSLRNFAPNANSTATGLYVFFYYLGGSLGGWVPSTFWTAGGWPACVLLIIAFHVVAITAATLFWRPNALQTPTTARSS
jgi:MFS family permease